MTQEQAGALNPDIKTLMVGKKTRKRVEIVPLSIADLKRMGLAIDATVQTFFGEHPDVAGLSLTETVPFIKAMIAGELGRMLALATGEEDPEILSGIKENPLLEELTSSQLMEVAEIVYSQNFAVTGKKLEALVPGLMKLMSQWKQP